MMTDAMTPIRGNTFPVKEELKKLGGRWDPEAKAWMVPAARAEEAKALVARAPKDEYKGIAPGASARPAGPPPQQAGAAVRCQTCGRESRVVRDGQCRDCWEEERRNSF